VETGRRNTEHGFSLIEALVALALVLLLVSGTASLMTVAQAATARARDLTSSVLFASQKADVICAASASWPLSPADSLDSDRPGFVDHLAADGRAVPASEAVYVRRWSVQPLPDSLTGAVALRVLVVLRADLARFSGPDVLRHPRAALVATACSA
jgi:prepilin-type N-terminal cleavage/methylation domain-containing protein